jgi:hypothetical protein
MVVFEMAFPTRLEPKTPKEAPTCHGVVMGPFSP